MRLPNASLARVEQEKVENYLLFHDHPDGAPKARFFERFGFERSDWDVLAKALLEHGQTNPVTKTVATGHGLKYIVDGPLETPNGRTPALRSVWIEEAGIEGPRLITAHPMQESR